MAEASFEVSKSELNGDAFSHLAHVLRKHGTEKPRERDGQASGEPP
jgi:hypothetical protein